MHIVPDTCMPDVWFDLIRMAHAESAREPLEWIFKLHSDARNALSYASQVVLAAMLQQSLKYEEAIARIQAQTRAHDAMQSGLKKWTEDFVDFKKALKDSQKVSASPPCLLVIDLAFLIFRRPVASASTSDETFYHA